MSMLNVLCVGSVIYITVALAYITDKMSNLDYLQKRRRVGKYCLLIFTKRDLVSANAFFFHFF